jgi:hypothetical protein
MNTLKNIYKKLSDKTELAKHEVNLSLIDTLNDRAAGAEVSITNANNIAFSLGDATNLWNKTFAKLKTEINNTEKNIVETQKVLLEINKQAKDLGIDKVPRVDQIEGYIVGYRKTLTALRGVVMDAKNRMSTDF